MSWEPGRKENVELIVVVDAVLFCFKAAPGYEAQAGLKAATLQLLLPLREFRPVLPPQAQLRISLPELAELAREISCHPLLPSIS